MPQLFNSGDWCVTPNGTVARIRYLITYHPDPDTGEVLPTEAIVQVPRAAKQFDDPAARRATGQRKKRAPRMAMMLDGVKYKLSELSKATLQVAREERDGES